MAKKYSDLTGKYDRRKFNGRPKGEVKETVVKRLTLEEWKMIERMRNAKAS